MIKIFAVFKQGNYRHACGGIFSTFDLALKTAKKLILGEKDNYHRYEIFAFDLDVPSNQTPLEGAQQFAAFGGEIEEPLCLARLKRCGGDIQVQMRYTPFKYNQVIQFTNEDIMSAFNEFDDKRDILFLGYLVQYMHDKALQKIGIPFDLGDKMGPYDRIINGYLQDDKVATFLTKTGELSKYHTISHSEKLRYDREVKEGKDVLLHSFEFTSLECTAVRYKGAISWARCRYEIREKDKTESYTLLRESAYTYNLQPEMH